MRGIPSQKDYFAIFDFEKIMERQREFTTAILLSVDIEKRTKELLRLTQDPSRSDHVYLGLIDSITYTLAREF